MRRAGGGVVVNVSSTAGLQGYAGIAGYVAAKWGLRGLTKAAALEFAPDGVRVCSVHPGRVDTEMQRAVVAHEGGIYDAARYLRPGSVAAAVLTAVTATPEAHITEVVVRPRG